MVSCAELLCCLEKSRAKKSHQDVSVRVLQKNWTWKPQGGNFILKENKIGAAGFSPDWSTSFDFAQ